MYQLTVLYNQPEDAATFDKYYDDVHTPIASKIPGLQRLTVNRPVSDPDGNPPIPRGRGPRVHRRGGLRRGAEQ